MIYNSFITTKTNSIIPQLINGKTLESKYNPEREAETLYSQIDKTYNIYIIAGVGSGIFLNFLSKMNPDAKIIGIEGTIEEINFLSQLDSFKQCLKNENITICAINELENVLINSYLPAVYGDIKIIFQKVWAIENQTYFEETKSIIQNVIKKISADYSVQSHFGKIWQKNILCNLELMESFKSNRQLNIDTSKIAAVIAAGPTLDSTINKLIKNRNAFYIITTDTSFQSLIKYNISPDIVVSIDGQDLSYNHFFNSLKSTTSFVFDLCANSKITNKLASITDKIFFFTNGHPLSNISSNFSSSEIPYIYTGSGTVTIAALDLAIKTGFSKIQIFGADFSYTNKPYTKGTYLDSLYNKSSTILQSSEKVFSKLMFRTELINVSKTKKTTEVLESYKQSLENYLKSQNIDFNLQNDIYEISFENKNNLKIKSSGFNFNSFINSIDKNNYVPLLPFIAYLRNQPEYKNENFENLVNLALKHIVRYN